MKCRHCGSELSAQFADLATAPPSNAYLGAERLDSPEKWYPLRVMVCETCWLVQTQDYTHSAELFDRDYAYFSSFSPTWLAHAQRYVAAMVERFGLGPHSRVVEIAANDGYLLKYVAARGIPCFGVEPTASTARAARALGIEIVEEFFGVALAERLAGRNASADLIAANNVLAHVPDINDFVKGFSLLLKPNGVATFEFPSLLQLVRDCQFDTIYHEHFSYLSLSSVVRILSVNGLTAFDVDELTTHGGSLRVFAQRSDSGSHEIAAAVPTMLAAESAAGIATPKFYAGMQPRIERIKNDLVTFLIDARREGHRVGGYGAAAKGNTLLNFSGVRSDLLPWIVDRNPAKQGKYTPGGRISIVPENVLRREKPDYVLILPWNLREEVLAQLAYVRDWGGRFVFAVPHLEVI